jgi:hypothetical protein
LETGGVGIGGAGDGLVKLLAIGLEGGMGGLLGGIGGLLLGIGGLLVGIGGLLLGRGGGRVLLFGLFNVGTLLVGACGTGRDLIFGGAFGFLTILVEGLTGLLTEVLFAEKELFTFGNTLDVGGLGGFTLVLETWDGFFFWILSGICTGGCITEGFSNGEDLLGFGNGGATSFCFGWTGRGNCWLTFCLE